MEDSIRSTYRTTRGAYRSCRCLWNFPLHRLSEEQRGRRDGGHTPEDVADDTEVTWESALTSAAYRQHDSSHFALNVDHEMALYTEEKLCR